MLLHVSRLLLKLANENGTNSYSTQHESCTLIRCENVKQEETVMHTEYCIISGTQ